MIEECFQPALQERAFQNVWFQQDGTTAHRAHISMDILRLIFPGRLISLQGDIAWPAHSPDLKPCDHLLWGYLKAKRLKRCPRSLQDLKQVTCEEVQRIPQVMLGTSECACSSVLIIKSTTCPTSCIKLNRKNFPVYRLINVNTFCVNQKLLFLFN